MQHHSNSASGHACYTQCLSRTIAAGWDSVAHVLDSFVRSCFLNALNFGGSILCLLYLNFAIKHKSLVITVLSLFRRLDVPFELQVRMRLCFGASVDMVIEHDS